MEIISRTELDLRVGDLGDELTDLCNEIGGGIVFVCVMKGGFMFFSDLLKHIKYPIEVDFVKCSSYDGQEQKSIEMHYDIEANIKDKTVFLVDDILDSGNTMNELKEHYMNVGCKTS
jgi:hypoxanthine phosphoribosyltransferase